VRQPSKRPVTEEYSHEPADPLGTWSSVGGCAIYARILRISGDPAKTDDGVEAYRSRVAPALNEQGGYAGARLFINSDTGAGMSITFWQDEQTLRASESALAGVRGDTMSRFGADAPVSENYEVVVQHRPVPTEAGNFVRVTSLDGDPARVDEAIRHFETEVVPALSRLAGSQAAVLFVDRSTGKALAATVWTTKDDLEASADEAKSIAARATEVTGASNPRVETYAVAFAELLGPAGH
jgi:heme-degrading monooxygenase HmoA